MPVGCLPPPRSARGARTAPSSPSLRSHCRCWCHAGGAQGGVPRGRTARPAGARNGAEGHPTGTHLDRGARFARLTASFVSSPHPHASIHAGPGAMAARAPWAHCRRRRGRADAVRPGSRGRRAGDRSDAAPRLRRRRRYAGLWGVEGPVGCIGEPRALARRGSTGAPPPRPDHNWAGLRARGALEKRTSGPPCPA